jgi:hypothetical protein
VSDSGDKGYESDSGDEGYESASEEPFDHLSTLGESSDHLSTLGGPSDRSPTSAEPLVPKPAPWQNSQKIMTPEKIKATKLVVAVGLVTIPVLGLVDIQVGFTNSSSSTS